MVAVLIASPRMRWWSAASISRVGGEHDVLSRAVGEHVDAVAVIQHHGVGPLQSLQSLQYVEVEFVVSCQAGAQERRPRRGFGNHARFV